MSPGFELDEGVILGAFLVAQHTVVGTFSEEIHPRLDSRVNAEFSDPLG